MDTYVQQPRGQACQGLDPEFSLFKFFSLVTTVWIGISGLFTKPVSVLVMELRLNSIESSSRGITMPSVVKKRQNINVNMAPMLNLALVMISNGLKRTGYVASLINKL